MSDVPFRLKAHEIKNSFINVAHKMRAILISISWHHFTRLFNYDYNHIAIKKERD